MVLRRLLVVCSIATLVSPALAESPDQVPPGDAQETMPEPPPKAVCIDDQDEPRRAVEAAFLELQNIHRTRVAGPAGQKLIELRVNALLDRLVGFDVFVDIALGDAWDAALADQKLAWRTTLRETLRRRYLHKLGSPLRAKGDIKTVVMRCDKAEVSLHISDRKGKHAQDVRLQLVASRVDSTTVWHAFDVAVDGVSLLETWRSRFRRIYADGGVSAIDQHMRGLAERYTHPD